MLFDVDFFKSYNDCYGHQAGDECLIKVVEAAIAIAQRAQEKLKQFHIPHLQSEINTFVTISLGIACQIPGLNSDYTQLVKDADSALYRAKRQGRNRYCLHTLLN